MKFYWQTPADLNLHAYTATLDTSGADDTIEIDGLIPGGTYSFQIAAYDSYEEADSSVITTLTAESSGEVPTIVSYTGNADDGADIDGAVTITYTTTACDETPYLVLTRDDDPYRGFYQTYVSDDGWGYGGAIPAFVGSVVSLGDNTYSADFYVPAADQNVLFQIMLGTDGTIPLSDPVNEIKVPQAILWIYCAQASPPPGPTKPVARSAWR